MDLETLEKAVLAINELLKTQKGINETNETRIAWVEQEVKNLSSKIDFTNGKEQNN